jgi:hypothetical protein
MCRRVSYKIKYEEKKIIFFASLMSLKKGVDPDPSVRGTDPGIRIRICTKMSRIPNTVWKNIPADIKITTNSWRLKGDEFP